MTRKRTFFGRLWRSALRGVVDGVPVLSQLAAVNDEMKRRKLAEDAAQVIEDRTGLDPSQVLPKVVQDRTHALVRLVVALVVVLSLVYLVSKGLVPADELFKALRHLVLLF